MYIKLGKTRINYLSPSTNDYIILGEVIKSSIQYQSPVYVRNLDELNIWFGQDFKEYSYFSELLNKGATLYLTGPLKEERFIDEDAGEIDYYNWPVIECLKLPETGQSGNRYVVNGKYTYIWYSIDDSTSMFMSTDRLPQELQSFKSKSLLNRDTLVIWEDKKYVSPSYGKHTLPEGYLEEVNIDNLDSDSLKNEKTSLVFEFKDTTASNRYIVFGDKCYYWGEKPKLKKEEYENVTGMDLSDVLKDKEDFIIKDTLAYSKTIRTANYFSSNITFSPLYTESSNVVYEKLKNNAHVEIISKTLGTDEFNPIEVSYSTDSNELSVSRFGYFEYYFQQEGIDFYDDITNRSKLIECRIIGDSFKWESGEWEMSGAKQENVTNLSKSLEVLMSSDVNADFLLIDSYSDYISTLVTGDLVGKLLTSALNTWSNTQILVQNTEKDYKYNYIEKDNKVLYFFNSMQLKGEYRPGWFIYLNGLLTNNFEFKTTNTIYPDLIQDLIDDWLEAGYKLEIKNFIEKWYVKKGEEPKEYSKFVDSRRKKLEEYKSNFLTTSDYYGFYEKLFDGTDYETSGLLRFVMCKVNREIIKHSEEFIGEQNYSKLQDILVSTLRTISSSYRIINKIYINNFTVDNIHNSLKITVLIEISDLEKNDIITDIEINYSK